MLEARTQFPQKVNLWTGIVGTSLIVPFFIEGSPNGQKYLGVTATKHNICSFASVSDWTRFQFPHVSNVSWFQQHDAPPHYCHTVRNYFNTIFPNKWIGRRGVVEWPQDLQNYLNSNNSCGVIRNRTNNIEDLERTITEEIRLIALQMLNNVIKEFEHHLA